MSYSFDVYDQTHRSGSILSAAENKPEPLFGEVIHGLPRAVNESTVRILKVKYFDDHFLCLCSTKNIYMN